MTQQNRPSPFSAAWWKRAIRATWIAAKDLHRDDGTHWAAAIAYYAMVSFIPILLLVALTASVAIDSDEAVQRLGEMMGDLLPEGESQIEQIVDRAYKGRAAAGFFSVLALLWAGTRIFSSATRALNVAYDIDRSYNVVKSFAVQVVMLLFVGGLLVAGIFARTFLDVVWQMDIGSAEERGLLINVIATVVPFVLTVLAFVIVYRYVPRHRPNWIPSFVGAFIAAGLFWGGRATFLLYLQRFANYGDIYGPISLVVIVILWIWIGALILLFGGQLVSHYHEILVEGEAPEDVERRHEEARKVRDQPARRSR